MNRVFGAYGFYLRCTFKNRILGLGRKLKSPRYVIGVILAVAYIWFFFFRSFSFAAEGSDSRRYGFGTIGLTFFYTLNLASPWILGPFGKGLMFRKSETQQLFHAPLSRGHLLFFKFLQSQGPILITAIIFSVLSYRFTDKPFSILLPSLYVVAALAHLHSMFAVLLVKKLRDAGGTSSVFAFVPGIVIVGLLFVGLWLGFQESGPYVTTDDLVHMIESPPLSIVLAPSKFMARFVVISTGTQIFTGLGILLAAGACFALLLAKVPFSFEDQAVRTAEVVMNLKKEGLSALSDKKKFVVKDKQTFPSLAPTGPVWRAIVWKNVVSIGRLQKKFIKLAFFIAIVIFFVARTVNRGGDDDGRLSVIISFVAFGIAAYASFLGPALLRVDLRIDIPHFDVLKSMPIRGRDLLMGEIMGPVLVTCALQWALVIIGLLVLPTTVASKTFDLNLKLAIFATAVPGFFGIAFAMFTLENLLALYLPSFARLGRGIKQGFDQFGQNLMGAVIRILAILMMLIPVGIVTAMIGFILFGLLQLSPLVAIPLTTALAALTLFGECYFLISSAEERYERFDLSFESLSVSE